MNEVIERLKKERQESISNYYEKGKDDGFTWAKAAHFESIVYVVESIEDMTDVDDHLDTFLKDQDALSFLNDAIDSDKNMGFDDVGFPTPLTTKYLAGWHKGVRNFWKEISAQVMFD